MISGSARYSPPATRQHSGPKLLILGGSSEASGLARRIADRPDLTAIISLAGRTRAAADLPLPHRVGGFGGAPGLAHFLCEQNIDLLIDATHPFATQISENAARAAQQADVPLLSIRRRPWEPAPNDNWLFVTSVEAAAAQIGDVPRRVFLTIGRQGLRPFTAQPQHFYLIRSIDPPAAELHPKHCRIICERGPFSLANEIALFSQHHIDILVSKNSGGIASRAKLDAARELKLPVIMIERPALAEVEHYVDDAAQATHWIVRRLGLTA